jgi:hypothetical protein
MQPPDFGVNSICLEVLAANDANRNGRICRRDRIRERGTISYGPLFWAEKRVASGIAAVTLAVIFVFTAAAEILILRIRQLTVRFMIALVAGSIEVISQCSRGRLQSDLCGNQYPFASSLSPPGTPAFVAHLSSFPTQRPSCSVITIISRSLPYPRILARGCFLDELTCVERFIICCKTKACSTNQPSAR